MSNVGKNLEPAKFGVTPTQNKAVDDFGQATDTPFDEAHGNLDRTHLKSDVDSSPNSQHHTLGQRRNQASPGDHIHDGITSSKLGPMQINTSGTDTKPVLVLTGAKGGNAALANLIALLQNVINFTDNTT